MEETPQASAIIQAFESEQYIQGQWNWLLISKGYKEIMRN